MLGSVFFRVFLRTLFKQIEFVLHRSDDKVILALLIILAFFLGSVARAFGSLRAFVDFLVVMLWPTLFFLDKLAAFEITRGYWITATTVLVSDDR